MQEYFPLVLHQYLTFLLIPDNIRTYVINIKIRVGSYYIAKVKIKFIVLRKLKGKKVRTKYVENS